MAGNSFGKLYKVTTFGESHGVAVGVIIDGCPSNILIESSDIQKFLDRRRPGGDKLSTTRLEKDQVQILSGVFDGRTLGTPICAIVKNEDISKTEYRQLKEIYRPGHADFTYDKKYGIRDYRSGGRSSGRETIGRVIAGAIAEIALSNKNISFDTIGFYDEKKLYDENNQFINDSIGGLIECRVKGVPAGIGEPVFDKLDAEIAKAVMSIGAVKGVEIGAGFKVQNLLGSENNDEMSKDKLFLSNNAGGILGGISTGEEIIVRAAIKPTPTIGKKQKTIDINGNDVEIELKGRNDISIVNRAKVVVESMVAITIFDYYLQQFRY